MNRSGSLNQVPSLWLATLSQTPCSAAVVGGDPDLVATLEHDRGVGGGREQAEQGRRDGKGS